MNNLTTGEAPTVANDLTAILGVVGADEQRRNRFELHRAAEALDPQPPIDWVVEPLFSRGTVSIVMGDPGSKKTYSLLDLGICVALGKTWLGLTTTKSPVLLVDEESGKRRIDRRLAKIMPAHGADAGTDLWYMTLAGLNLREPSELQALEAKISETKAALVIIDTLADIMQGADENQVKDVQPIMLALRSIADKLQCAIILIHHSNKTGKYRGSSALLGAVDVMMKVESKPGSSNVRFTLEKNRDGEIFDLSAEAQFDNEQFCLSGGTGKPRAKSQKGMSTAQQFVLEYLYRNGASTVTVLTEKPVGCTPDAARKAIYDLKDLGVVERVDAGGPGEAATYDLTEKSREISTKASN